MRKILSSYIAHAHMRTNGFRYFNLKVNATVHGNQRLASVEIKHSPAFPKWDFSIRRKS